MNKLVELKNLFVSIEKHADQPSKPEARIKIMVDGECKHVVAEGDGPINALDNALRKALAGLYFGLNKVRLVNYEVIIINGQCGSASKVQVSITSGDGKSTWQTVGVSTDIIEASWFALVESYERRILSRNHRRRQGGTKKSAAML